MTRFNNMDLRGKPQVTHLQWTVLVEDDEHAGQDAVGVMAQARLAIPIGGTAFHLVTITSGGLWGIEESDDKAEREAYRQEVYAEERSNLWAELKALTRDIEGGLIVVEG